MNTNTRTPKKCLTCGKDFVGKSNQTYCSARCYKIENRFVSLYPGLPTGTVGAIQELKAAINLFEKGYEVLRALSPNCSCDLLALKKNKLFSFEVRTAYKNKKGGLCFSTQNIRADHLILVIGNEIIYIFNYLKKLKTNKDYKKYKQGGTMPDLYKFKKADAIKNIVAKAYNKTNTS